MRLLRIPRVDQAGKLTLLDITHLTTELRHLQQVPEKHTERIAKIQAVLDRVIAILTEAKNEPPAQGDEK